MKNCIDNLPVLMCIGSDKVSGDMLGPMVGKILIDEYRIRAFVYGILGRNINGTNIKKYYDFIKKIHINSIVIAIDACLGLNSEIGEIKIGNNGVGAGNAIRKGQIRYGDIGIVGVVGENSKDNVMSLVSVDFKFIEELSRRVALYIFKNFSNILTKKI